MKNVLAYLLGAVLVWLSGFAMGRISKPAAQAMAPKPEVILDDAGSRIMAREPMQQDPQPIAPGVGTVQAEAVVTVRSHMQPEALTTIRIQEVQTIDGPRFVVEAPEGMEVVSATETRRGVVNVPKLRFLGLATKTDGEKIGLSYGQAGEKWFGFGSVFKDQLLLSVGFRF